jgi:hypothetical protein
LEDFRSDEVFDFVRQRSSIPNLRHELSELVEASEVPHSDTRHTLEELRIFASLRQNFEGASPSVIGLGALIDAALPMMEGAISVRTYRSQTSPVRGQATLFAQPGEIAMRLAAVDAWLLEQESLGIPRSFQAVVAMSAFCALHPLTDGNGRMSRILFNLLLYGDRRSIGCYLPIATLAARSSSGFLISLKLSQFGNEWKSICKFHVASLLFILKNFSSNIAAWPNPRLDRNACYGT